MARAAASCPAPWRPVSSTDIGVGGVPVDRFAQCPNGGAVAKQRAFHAAPRVRQKLLRHRQLTRELRVPRLELAAAAAAASGAC